MKYRAQIEGFFRSISEIFFVKQWKSGLVLWLALLILYPEQWFVGTIALLASSVFHAVFNVTLTQEVKQWLGLNAFLIGFGYLFYCGFEFSASYFGYLIALLFVHQILYDILLEVVGKQQQLPLLTLSFIIIVNLIAWLSPPHVAAATSSVEWVTLGVRVNDVMQHSLPESAALFFRSLGTLLFMKDIVVGIIITLIILQYSRILFSLAIVSFLPLLLIRDIVPPTLNMEAAAFNVMITVIMIGAVLEVPSRWSYRNAALFGILALLLGILFLIKSSPCLNLPFVLAIYAFKFSKPYLSAKGTLPFDFSAGSPEQNLYYATNRRDRYAALTLPSYSLPFFGEWKVTQAHQGEFTHKSDWQHAWDFEQVDDAGKFSRNGSTHLSDFYAYRQPVCASLEGEVVNMQAFVPDNEAGTFNFAQNWGNTVVLRHPGGHCSAYSHLSFLPEALFVGKWVNKGEVIGYCGNSGRSDRPHLHFQIQPTGKIGEKTLRVPLKKYIVRDNGSLKLKVCDYPLSNELVSNHIYSPRVAEAFNFPYGKELLVNGTIDSKEQNECWISSVDFYNHTFLWCEQRKAAAYFFSEDGVFYFADYFGPKDCLLNFFSLAASRVVFSEQHGLTYKDQLPLNRVQPALSNFVVDMVTPIQPVKEVTCNFAVREEKDRTIYIQGTIATVFRFALNRSHVVAASELVLPYGTQSMRLKMEMKHTRIDLSVTY